MFKSLSLVAKYLARPIVAYATNGLKYEQGRSQTFTMFLKRFGNSYNKINTKIQEKLMRKEMVYKPMSDEKAVQSGAELICEFLTQALIGGVALYEINKSDKDSQAKAAKQAQLFENVKQRLAWLGKANNELFDLFTLYQNQRREKLQQMEEKARELIVFWYGSFPESLDFFDTSMMQKWYEKDPEFDETIRSRFEEDVEKAANGEYDYWINESPVLSIALLILLDQFPRNLFRNNPRAFAYDAKALEVSQRIIARGYTEIPHFLRGLLVHPHMHSEDAEVQAEGIRLCYEFENALPEGSALAKTWREITEYSEGHKVIIDRFGRFPHRNAILGRESTPEEEEFMKEHPGF